MNITTPHTSVHSLVDVPRPFIDTITHTSQALSVFSMCLSRPFREEALILLTDSSRRGIGLFTAPLHQPITHPPTPSHGGEALGHLVVGITSAHPSASACYVLTIEKNTLPTNDDAERWFSFNDVCDRAGIVLLNWCVRGFHSSGRGATWSPMHVAGLG